MPSYEGHAPMAVEMNPTRIFGNWKSGYALDIHTISSTYLGINEFGHDVFDNKRSYLGELLYRLKYQEDRSAASGIVEAAVAFLQRYRNKFDVMVPVPASGRRRLQPVLMLANGIGKALDLPVANCVSANRPATQLKGVMDPERRNELLEDLYRVERAQTQGKSVLLFDDLYRSGATMNAVTELLVAEGRAEAVRVLTITKTRSRQ
ncbi:MAG: phosphoribosyltransferase family protein [Bryobacterales bacterium]|nr:phosphoribosyltransferase family protein [Bryobacterales bacterium]MDE0624383.1 phosphoribosyltransferase family protein [Bryobacterales bacterium]